MGIPENPTEFMIFHPGPFPQFGGLDSFVIPRYLDSSAEAMITFAEIQWVLQAQRPQSTSPCGLLGVVETHRFFSNFLGLKFHKHICFGNLR